LESRTEHCRAAALKFCFVLFLFVPFFTHSFAGQPDSDISSQDSLAAPIDSVQVRSVSKVEQPVCRLAFRPDSSTSFLFKMTEKDFPQRIIRHVGDMVKNIPGGSIFDLVSTGLPVYARLRGSSIQQSQITIDGFPVTHSQFGPYDLSLLPIAAFNTAEITHFNFTAISGHSGSIVNLTTPNNQLDHPTTKINWQKGSFGDSEVDVEYGQKVAAQTTLVGAVSYQSSAGKFVNSEYDAQRIRCKLNSQIKPNWNLKYQLFHNRSDIDLPVPENWQLETSPKYFHRKTNHYLHLLDLRGNVSCDSLEDIRIRTYYSSLYQDFTDQAKAINDVYRNRFYGLHVQRYHLIKQNVITYGWKSEYRWLSSNRLQPTAFFENRLFIYGSIPINSDHQIRWYSDLELNSKYNTFLVPKLVYQRSLSQKLKFEFSYEISRRLPDFYELYWNRTDITGNPGLKAEKVQHSACSIHYSNDNVIASSSFYIKEIKNPIILTFAGSSLDVRTFINQSSELISGYDHHVQLRPIYNFRISNQLEIIFISNGKKSILVNYPRYINKLIVEYEDYFFQENLQAGVRILTSLIGRHLDFSGGLYDYPPYFYSQDLISGKNVTPVIEVGIHAKISSFKIQFSLENILLTKYQSVYGYPMREMTSWLNMSWAMTN